MMMVVTTVPAVMSAEARATGAFVGAEKKARKLTPAEQAAILLGKAESEPEPELPPFVPPAFPLSRDAQAAVDATARREKEAAAKLRAQQQAALLEVDDEDAPSSARSSGGLQERPQQQARPVVDVGSGAAPRVRNRQRQGPRSAPVAGLAHGHATGHHQSTDSIASSGIGFGSTRRSLALTSQSQPRHRKSKSSPAPGSTELLDSLPKARPAPRTRRAQTLLYSPLVMQQLAGSAGGGLQHASRHVVRLTMTDGKSPSAKKAGHVSSMQAGVSCESRFTSAGASFGSRR